jgi:tyrosyl-tRNA synthetase
VSVLLRATDPEGPRPVLVNNGDWWRGVSAMGMLRDIGRHFRVPTMLRRESVARRMESQEGISFTEFSYQLLQAHDFYHLHDKLKVCVQIGGSDQWGNITAGIDYAKRRGSTARLAGLTVPLIATKDGSKLGKSAGNAVWLSEGKTSHVDLYQYFVQNATDEMVPKWMGLMTLMSREAIAEACSRGGGAAQKELGYRVVELLRGTEAAEEAKSRSEALFSGAESAENALLEVSRDRLQKLSVAELALEVGLVPSKAEARRLVEQGGLYINEARIDDATAKVQCAATESVLFLRAGKKKRVMVKVV